MRRWVGGILVFILLATGGGAPRAAMAAGPAVDAKIEVVWPHDAQGRPAPVATARLVNVEAYLFERGTLNPVACDFANPVILHAARDGSSRGYLYPADETLGFPPGQAIAGHRETRIVDGKTFPVWVFNNVFVPEPDLWKSYFFLEVQGADYRTNVWAHVADARTMIPDPYPADSVVAQNPDVIEPVIQIVWPHDERGVPRPVTEAPLVNIGVDLFKPPFTGALGRVAVNFGFTRPVWLLRALNDGYLERVKVADAVVPVTRQLRDAPPIVWPRWIFNDVDVAAARDPVNKYYFAVEVEGVKTQTTIWAHGADPRTYFPQKDVPARTGANCP